MGWDGWIGGEEAWFWLRGVPDSSRVLEEKEVVVSGSESLRGSLMDVVD